MADLFARLQLHEAVQSLTEQGLYPFYRAAETRHGSAEVVIDGRTLVQASAHDYLGLSCDARVIEAAVAATRRLGTGTCASRVANGSLALHEELEGRLADFLSRPAVMVTATGYQANLALGALLDRGDKVAGDQLIHASLIDAVALSRARLVRFRHNDLTRLERLLQASDGHDFGLIITEGLFSTSGDLCDLPGIAELARRHGVRLALDSAHDLGVLGRHGRGAAEHFGLEPAVDVQTVTFSKALGGVGGAVAGPDHVIAHLRHDARSMLFTSALSPASAAAALAALDIVIGEPERRQRVRQAAALVSGALADLGFAVTPSDRPIVAVPADDELSCFRLWKELFDAGVLTCAMIPPGVPDGRSVIRVAVTAAHTDRHLERIVDAFAAGKTNAQTRSANEHMPA
ncbi:aminotransferase class I/II-fold pyridoxal phosphate-dependent enzyme [Nonomuraea sp. K274]|uniref:8-amino-7-oxononanoate synthase n=1 Tax=Nonomuraea cypriaca TaxID=1187855 RepID=A0A931A6Y2_9ACTN|nr:aminotransferase class I/II-fold pyridoxal phosphate-dependent enzyme [Nonomuraea cypriaca]MBF8184495.1 aminotransferase class I/II-fold pyridoxal phosphate-dependent enzyme [Nonomuraea cypriaca]